MILLLCQTWNQFLQTWLTIQQTAFQIYTKQNIWFEDSSKVIDGNGSQES